MSLLFVPCRIQTAGAQLHVLKESGSENVKFGFIHVKGVTSKTRKVYFPTA